MKKETYTRIVCPDSHGCFINKTAKKAFLADVKRHNPDEFVFLGDQIEAAAQFSKHPIEALEERNYSVDADFDETNKFFDECQEAAPKCRDWHYLGGNHEFHVERFAAQTLGGGLAERFVKRELEDRLKLSERGFKYYSFSGFHHGLGFRNTIKLGKCYFMHGYSTAKTATDLMLRDMRHNVVHGHTHRAAEVKLRTIDGDVIAGWCPGTLADLQPPYFRTRPTGWTHGYAVQHVYRSGLFEHRNVTILNGKSLYYWG